MNVQKLFSGIKYLGKFPSRINNISVRGITSDSRKVEPGGIFIAYDGVVVDGHTFISQAIQKGAVAIVGEKNLKLTIPYIRVNNGRLTLAKIWSNRYGNPEKKLNLIGVTGTDGKTTTSTLIYEILKNSGKKPGLISTITAKIGNHTLDTGFHTTSPDQDVFFKLLFQMSTSNCKWAVIEVTSHALDQFRYGDSTYDIGVLTNLTHDHLEFHKTITNYRNAKAKLFTASDISILNKNSNGYSFFKKAAKKKVVPYDTKSEIRHVRYLTKPPCQKFEARFNNKWLGFETKLLGEYNLENILAAVKVAEELKINPKILQKTVKKFQPPKGRFEIISNRLGLNIIVDFAHTEQGIRSVLGLVNQHLKKNKEKIIVIFGTNGERDKTKRPGMGKTACQLADTTVITLEDPRRENIDQIFSDIQKGCRRGGGIFNKTYFRVDDRAQAIGFAVNHLARKGDWILILGKGHEKSMNIGGTEYPWDDVKEVKKSLTQKGILLG